MCADINGAKLPDYIDVLRLARSEDVLEGGLPLAKMKRLANSLLDTDGNVQIQLKFASDIEGLHYIMGHVQGELPLTCQRCSKRMLHKVDHDFALSPVWTDDQARKLPENYEPLMLPEDERVVLAELIEDELILQLPVMARHEEDDCHWQPANDDSVSEIETEKPNPFAALAVLKDFKPGEK